LAIGVFFPELDQCFAGDDVHKIILSQFEIQVKRSPSEVLSQRGVDNRKPDGGVARGLA